MSQSLPVASSPCCSPAPEPPAADAAPTADVREVVKARYGAAAKAVTQGKKTSCCGGAAADAPEIRGVDPITRDLYSSDEAAAVPEDAIAASFGCGNPTALAELSPGEVVLDLGSGGGIDVLLSARRVGPTGKAYGLDMTAEMLELARANAAKAGATNVEFLQGTIESIPLPDGSVDVIISNCVINLSSDKDQVLREAFRVLKPGGRMAVSDLVLTREVPAEVRADLNLWTGCVAGSLLESEYTNKLSRAGFEAIDVEPTRVYDSEDAREMASAASCCGSSKDGIVAALDGALMSAFIRARKPAG
jgi:arsenite methyltransferase